jgi:hypothetical protein
LELFARFRNLLRVSPNGHKLPLGMFMRPETHCARAVVATFVSVAFLWTLVLGVSPQLHGRVHSDATKTGHTCAVTFIVSGSCNHAAHVPLVSPPIPVIQFSTIATLTPQWVESPFLGASILEHAPPAHS